MIPIRDTIMSARRPYVTWTLILVNFVVFVLELAMPDAETIKFFFNFGLVPAKLITRETSLLTLVTSIFIHGGWLHLLGNMWVLFIFGDNVEDRLGHLRYSLYYLLWGVLANVLQLLFMSGSDSPIVGASGAIAGVMGAYLWFFPFSRVLTLVPLVFLYIPVYVPASIFLVLWFFLQFFNGVMAISGSNFSGIAWWAHIGGFVLGYFMARLFELKTAKR